MAKQLENSKRKKPAGKATKRTKREPSSDSSTSVTETESEHSSVKEVTGSEAALAGLHKCKVACRKGVEHLFYVPKGYSEIAYLAEGAFGVVCTAKSPEGGEIVIKKHTCDNEVNTESALRELYNLWWFTKAKSQSIVKLLDVWTCKPSDDHHLYLVVEKFDHSLNHYMNGNKKLSVPQWRRLCDLVCNALYELHSCGSMHRDMKPENVVVDSKCTRIAVIDLGSVRSSDQQRSETQPPLTPVSKVTTEGYRGPETFIDDEDYDASLDVFGAGCLLAALRFSREIFPKNEDLEKYLNSTDKEANAFLNKKFSVLKKSERDLLKAMLQRQPADRITAAKLKDQIPDSTVKKLTPRYKEPVYVATCIWNMVSKIKNLAEEFQMSK
eukprot:TRINITY_DN16264_c0_g1_i1.p1 TRINITY_DN16264_c0_g1~~TRINITY_DN16264_c0_g1_i1.p1  ORF type:complete len:383 (+),score=70.80 TRINITY_DN16264_c0_g1_i1:52-1200(+)